MVKRLIIACDGTWVNSDNGFVRDSWLPWKTGGQLATPSNVTRICRALKTRSENDTQQIVYYQGGLGSQNNAWSFFVGGFLGEGISENVREAYAFICSNYENGDEIFLLGFSRGAFTARSIGGLISAIGLLTTKGLGSFYPIFKDWENQMAPGYTPAYGSADWPIVGRPAWESPQYLEKLKSTGLTRFPNGGIPIKAIGVWDTVGSLGVPDLRIFGVPVHSDTREEYSFINTEVAPNVQNAYQALAIDEQRTPFSPTVWEWPSPEGKPALEELKQCWFPGVHSSVGGGYQDTSISDITLAWMMSVLSKHLTFDSDYINLQRQKNTAFYQTKDAGNPTPPVRSWAFGLINRSDTGLQAKVAGASPRTPGEYVELNPRTGKPTKTRLVKTCEFIHPSVRYRIVAHGPGLAGDSNDHIGKGVYEPAALKGWQWIPPNQAWDMSGMSASEQTRAKDWDAHGKWIVKRADGSETFIVESEISEKDNDFEAKLLDSWTGVRESLAQDAIKPFAVGGDAAVAVAAGKQTWGAWFKSWF